MRTIIAVCVLSLATAVAQAASDAETMLEKSGIQGGLIAVLGCDDTALLADLQAAGPYVVTAFGRETAAVEKARAELREKGIYGPVTVHVLKGDRLPFVDHLVNLMIVSSVECRVSEEESRRVRVPGGVFLDTRHPTPRTVTSPVPDGMDEWTHYLYDASNNAVSKDEMVAPLERLQWVAAPDYARSHDHMSSLSAMVSAGGRVFSIIDEGSIESVFLPDDWQLVARDAFNGVLLWKRPIGQWESRLRGFRSGPPEIGRRLVAVGDAVYTALGYGQPLKQLDAATGETRMTYEGTAGAREILYRDGMLYVLADDLTEEDHRANEEWFNTQGPKNRGYQFPKEPLHAYGRRRIMALAAETGEVRWTKQDDVAAEVMPTTLCAGEGSLCFINTKHVVCLDPATGEEQWRAERSVQRRRWTWSSPTLILAEDVALSLDAKPEPEEEKDIPEGKTEWIVDNAHRPNGRPAEVVAFSLADGRELWRASSRENYDTPPDLFAIRGVVWFGELSSAGDPGFVEGRDLHTGEIVARRKHVKNFYTVGMGHHRCYRNKATEQYIITGRAGVEFMDLEAMTTRPAHWIRGACQYGVMPANGMVYVPPHSCACFTQAKLNGFLALSGEEATRNEDPVTRVEKGSMYAEFRDSKFEFRISDAEASAWPTYRHDHARSGRASCEVGDELKSAWTATIGGRLSAPVVAGNRVLLSSVDEHTLYALDAETGKVRWHFTAGSRIDSPPTVAGVECRVSSSEDDAVSGARHPESSLGIKLPTPDTGLCYFGCRDGYVYALRASDGALVWKTRAAPAERWVMDHGRLESAWPVHGSVLLLNNTLYCVAGRSTFLDGGLRLLALHPATGEREFERTLSSMERGGWRGREKWGTSGIETDGALPDILASDGTSIFMRDNRFDLQGKEQNASVQHLFAPDGFLADQGWHRTYWQLGEKMSTGMTGYGAWPGSAQRSPAGRILSRDGDTAYGFGRDVYDARGSHVGLQAGYRYFAARREPNPKYREDLEPKQKRRTPKTIPVDAWSKTYPVKARAIALTPEKLVAGGIPETEETVGGKLLLLDRATGERISEIDLPAPPVWDGMAAAYGKLFMTLTDGRVICLK